MPSVGIATASAMSATSVIDLCLLSVIRGCFHLLNACVPRFLHLHFIFDHMVARLAFFTT